MWGAVHEIITCASFGENRLRGFGVAMGRILAFSIDLLRRHYNFRTTMRVRDFQVKIVITRNRSSMYIVFSDAGGVIPHKIHPSPLKLELPVARLGGQPSLPWSPL